MDEDNAVVLFLFTEDAGGLEKAPVEAAHS